jgi:flagellin-like protein
MSLITLLILIVLFVALVWGGFWVIARAGLPRAASYIFGAIVLIVIIIALVAMVDGRWDGPIDDGVRVRVN